MYRLVAECHSFLIYFLTYTVDIHYLYSDSHSYTFIHKIRREPLGFFIAVAHHFGKISPVWWGWGVHAHYIYHHVQSRSLRHPISFLSLCYYVLCGQSKTEQTTQTFWARIFKLLRSPIIKSQGTNSARLCSLEPVFLNVYGAPESIPRNEFRQPM